MFFGMMQVINFLTIYEDKFCNIETWGFTEASPGSVVVNVYVDSLSKLLKRFNLRSRK
jgi:hypothetical protein